MSYTYPPYVIKTFTNKILVQCIEYEKTSKKNKTFIKGVAKSSRHLARRATPPRSRTSINLYDVIKKTSQQLLGYTYPCRSCSFPSTRCCWSERGDVLREGSTPPWLTMEKRR